MHYKLFFLINDFCYNKYMAEQREKRIEIQPASQDSQAQPVKIANLSEFLAGKTFNYYLQKSLLPVIVAVAISIGFLLVLQIKTVKETIDWLFYLVMYLVQVVIVGWVVYRAVRQEKLEIRQAVVLAGFMGLAIGLLLAIFRLIWQQQFWQIFNLIFEPVYSAVVAMGLGVVIYNLFPK